MVDPVALCPRLLWTERHPVFDYRRLRFARQGLAERLCIAAEALPEGFRLALVECYRTPAIQRAMHDHTRDRLRAAFPGWSPQRLGREANRFSAPLRIDAPPPHTTGGAVDLTILDRDGKSLDFLSPYVISDAAGAPMAAPGLSAEARANRDLLVSVLNHAGITNYPSEWWHWSYGDQAWAYRGGHPHALYGALPPPEGLDSGEFRLHLDPGI